MGSVGFIGAFCGLMLTSAAGFGEGVGDAEALWSAGLFCDWFPELFWEPEALLPDEPLEHPARARAAAAATAAPVTNTRRFVRNARLIQLLPALIVDPEGDGAPAHENHVSHAEPWLRRCRL
jgi:hypothetical protein